MRCKMILISLQGACEWAREGERLPLKLITVSFELLEVKDAKIQV